MAGSPYLLDGNEQGVAVTICFDGFNRLKMPTGCTLVPQFLTRPAQ